MPGEINGAIPKGREKKPRNHCIFPEIMRQSNRPELFLTIQSGRSHKKWQQNKINKTYLQNSEQFRD